MRNTKVSEFGSPDALHALGLVIEPLPAALSARADAEGNVKLSTTDILGKQSPGTVC